MKKILLITLPLLLIVGCDYAPTEHTHSDSEPVEIDWILTKNPEYVDIDHDWIDGEDVTTIYTGIGYTFIGNNSVTNHNIPDHEQEGFDGTLYFEYESEMYSFNISDSYHEEAGKYFITGGEDELLEMVNIICYDNMSYCHINFQQGIAYVLSLTSPFEIIDYR
jgi:hypothetical protein